jgi:hypothetical protein
LLNQSWTPGASRTSDSMASSGSCNREVSRYQINIMVLVQMYHCKNVTSTNVPLQMHEDSLDMFIIPFFHDVATST